MNLPVIIVIIVLISVPSISAQSESGEIPSWIKGIADFWVDGRINDAEFIEALEFMIDNNVIKLGNTVSVANTMSVEMVELKKENGELQEKFNVIFKDKKRSDKSYNNQIQTLINEKRDIIDEIQEEYFDDIQNMKKEYDNILKEKEIEIEKLKNQAP